MHWDGWNLRCFGQRRRYRGRHWGSYSLWPRMQWLRRAIFTSLLMKFVDCETDQCAEERSDNAPERDAVFRRLDCWHYAGHDCGCHHHLVGLTSHMVCPIAPCAEHVVKGSLATKSSSELDHCSCPDRGMRQCRSCVYSRRSPYRSHC
jgi:hypothetical protein